MKPVVGFLDFISLQDEHSLNILEREPVNQAGKVTNLFLVTIEVYRLEIRKMEVCLASGSGGPLGASSFINSS